MLLARALSKAGKGGAPAKYDTQWMKKALSLVESIQWHSGRMWGPNAISDAEAARRAAKKMLEAKGKASTGQGFRTWERRIRDDLNSARLLRFHAMLSGILKSEPYTSDVLRPFRWFATDKELEAEAATLNSASPRYRAEIAASIKCIEQKLRTKSKRRLRSAK